MYGMYIFFYCISDDVFLQNELENNRVIHGHNRTDSTATTASESEFKRSFQSRRKCFVQRNDSQQEYERMSCRVLGLYICVIILCIQGFQYMFTSPSLFTGNTFLLKFK
jgi:hypothetical protein